jgi:hypothetical protein
VSYIGAILRFMCSTRGDVLAMDVKRQIRSRV